MVINKALLFNKRNTKSTRVAIIFIPTNRYKPTTLHHQLEDTSPVDHLSNKYIIVHLV